MRTYEVGERTIGRILADQAADRGDHTCLRWQGSDISYTEMDQQTNRYANGFRSIGVEPGDHVSMLMPNCPEFLYSLWGLSKLGAVAVPLNTAAKGDLLRYFITQSDSSWLVLGEEWLEQITSAIRDVSHIKGICVFRHVNQEVDTSFSVAQPIYNMGAFDAADDRRPAVSVQGTDPHLIVYTSGTTGPSKGVVSPYTQGLSAGSHILEAFGYTSDDVLYTCLPLFHVNALWYTVYTALYAGATVALAPHFSASNFWQEIRDNHATAFNTLGAMTNIIWKLPPSPADRDHGVRICVMVPVTRELSQGFKERYGITVVSAFAMTENYAVTILNQDYPLDKAGSAGQPPSYSALAIHDDDDKIVPNGIVGEICIYPREPGLMMLGYYKMPDATAEAMRNGWFHTGDRGYVDDDGYLFFVDRKKDAIRRRGENISSYEVEMLIAKHPLVAEVAAVPVASELSEDEVVAYVVLNSEQQLPYGELFEFCISEMARYMVPRFIYYIDALPKTPSEKVEKYKLRLHAEQCRDELWDSEVAYGRGSTSRFSS